MTYQEKLTQALATRANLTERRLYYEGDHWQEDSSGKGAKGWIGPLKTADSDVTDLTTEAVKKLFTSRNLIRKAISNHRDAVVGDEIRVSVTTRDLEPDEELSDEEKSLQAEAQSFINDWWNRERVQHELQKAVPPLLYAKVEPERTSSPMRLFFKKGAIRFKACNPESAGVVEDLDGDVLYGFYRYEDEDNNYFTEISILAENLDEDLSKQLAEYQDQEQNFFLEQTTLYNMGETSIEPPLPFMGYQETDTLIIILRNNKVYSAAAYPLNGNLTIYDAERQPLITDNTLELQRAYNLALTMMVNNLVVAGFLERILLGVQLPGKWMKDGVEVEPDVEGATFIPEPIYVGPGTTGTYQGEEIYDQENKLIGRERPQVIFRDPVSVKTFEDAMNVLEFSFYDAVSQLHVLISGDATATGRSRVQATNEFVSSLGLTESAINYGVIWMLETMLHWSSFLRLGKESWLKLNIDANCKLSAVQPSEEYVRLLAENIGKLWDSKFAIEQAGIDEPEQMLQRIVSELSSKFDMELEQEAQRRAAMPQPEVNNGSS